MKKNTKLLFLSFLTALFSLLSACGVQPDRTTIQQSTTQAAPVSVQAGDVVLLDPRAERLDSYQTHYMMTYPRAGHQFILLNTSIEGVSEPEVWGRANLTLADSRDRYEPVHVRRVLFDGKYE